MSDTVTGNPWLQHLSIVQAASVIRAGGLVAYPTEGVWGLGCDPFSEDALQRVLKLKRRKMGMGVILVAANLQQLQPYLAGLKPSQIQVLKDSWPGPVTWLIPNNGYAPEWITGGRETLAVRVTDHPLVQALCVRADSPIVSTSANPHKIPSAKTALKVRCYFGDQVDYVTAGKTGGRTKPSAIFDLISGKQIR
ncbi:MAG: threonylcarbamoyl-AMP synthase [Cellvibrionaceae bacterium]